MGSQELELYWRVIPSGTPCLFIRVCISVSCVKITVIKEPFLISIHTSYHCPY